MAKVKDEIGKAQRKREQASEALRTAARERNAAKSDSPEVPALKDAVKAARQVLDAAETKLRKIYKREYGCY
jgi:hypothetical protein